jgi:hypothetical protein
MGGFRPLAESYPQHVVDNGAGAVDKWNTCNKFLTLRKQFFARSPRSRGYSGKAWVRLYN